MADWSQWSKAQLACLMALDFAVPLHETHVARRYNVRENTRRSLLNAGLIAREFFYAEGASYGMPFFRLTQEGLAVKRDYVNWHRRVANSIGSVPAFMRTVADAEVF